MSLRYSERLDEAGIEPFVGSKAELIRRLPEPIGYIPPAEVEANYDRHLASQVSTVAA